MTTDHPPFLAGQRVHLNSTTRPGDGHVLAVHPDKQMTGWEVIVRTFDTPEAPGRTVNVFMTSPRCSLLTPTSPDQRPTPPRQQLSRTAAGGAR